MTTQTAINAQSIGTSTNVGNGKFSISPLTIASGTTAFVVSLILTNGTTGDVSPAQKVRVWYTSTTHTVSATNAPKYLGQTARYVDVKPNSGPSEVAIADSSLEPMTGANFHCWVDAPAFPSAGTLSVILVELP